MSFRITDHELHVRHRGTKGGQLLETGIVLQILNIEIPAALQVIHRQPAHHLGPVQHFIALLTAGIIITQGEKRRAQQKQRQHHHAGSDKQLPPVKSLKSLVNPLHPSAFSGCLEPTTSNLYPTPQTVLSAH